jgi:putative SOS response-associated peptidase YedK
MPVWLTREEEFDTWLRRSADAAFALARGDPAEQMRVVHAGFAKEEPPQSSLRTARARSLQDSVEDAPHL